MHVVRWQRSGGPEFCLSQRGHSSRKELHYVSTDPAPTAQATSCVPALGLSTYPGVPPLVQCIPPYSPLAGLSTLCGTPRITEASVSRVLELQCLPFGWQLLPAIASL